MPTITTADLIAAAPHCAGDPDYEVRKGPLADEFNSWLAGPEIYCDYCGFGEDCSVCGRVEGAGTETNPDY